MAFVEEKKQKSLVKVRLFELIGCLSEEEQKALLKELEERFYARKRRYERRPWHKAVDYSNGNAVYTDFIQDISAGGVFLETRNPFRIGEKISMTFYFPDYPEPIQIQGKIARMSPRGVGVKFDLSNQAKKRQLKSLVESI